jgi:YHS domain-containing protein
MSDYVWCHGPNCHLSHTVDRVRGSKGSKVLRTKRIKLYGNSRGMYSYFCSNTCYNEFANKYVEQIIAIAPRTEPLETPINDPERTKHTTQWGYTYYNTRIEEKNVDNS